MGHNLERLVQKAKAARPTPRMGPANTLPIVAETRAELPERIDRLISRGKLTEADRPRCVPWREMEERGRLLRPEQLAVLEAQFEIERENVPDTAAAWRLMVALVLHDLGIPPEGKSVAGDFL